MITEQQRQDRRKYLGSSDCAACFTDKEGRSLDPFKTLADVVASKIYEFEPENNTSESIKSGVRWEPYIIDWAANELGVEIETNPDKIRFINTAHLGADGQPIFSCNLDGFYTDKKPIIVEAKKTRLWKEWGGQDSDEVPMRVILQCHQQFLCTGWDEAIVAAMIQGDEKLFKVERNQTLIDKIIERGTFVWNTYVIPKVMPPDSLPGDIETFKRIVRVPEKFAEVDNSLVLEWESHRRDRLDAEKLEEAWFAKVLLALGDAEGAYLDDGRMLTYFSQKGADIIDRKRLQTEYPDVYQAVTRENSYRVARIKKG